MLNRATSTIAITKGAPLEAVLQELLQPKHLFMGFGTALPIQILYDALLIYVIPPKSKKWFWATVLSVAVVTVFFRPIMNTDVRGFLGIFQSVFLPMFLLSGPVWRRIMVCSIAMVLMAISELSACVVWGPLTGVEVMNPDLAWTYGWQLVLCGVLGYGLVLVPGMIVVKILCQRVFVVKVDPNASARVQRAAQWQRILPLLPLLQIPFIFIVLGVSFNESRGEWNYVVTSVGLLTLCAVVDVLLFIQTWRSVNRQRSELKATMLEERVEGYLRDVQALQDELAEAARFRHDVRNHQAVVELLCARQDYGEARAYLMEVSAPLRASEGGR